MKAWPPPLILTPVVPLNAEVKICAACGKSLHQLYFSNRQWYSHAIRRCNMCTKAGRAVSAEVTAALLKANISRRWPADVDGGPSLPPLPDDA